MLALGAQAASAEDWHVDARNMSGAEAGTPEKPFTTIQAALDAAMDGDTVRVAQGTYPENLVIEGKRVALRGGYVGGEAGDYDGGAGGDFAGQSPWTRETRIEADSDAPAILVRLTESSGSTIDGFAIAGGLHGILLDTMVTWPHIADMTISRNLIEKNGQADTQHRGGGLSITGSGHLISGCVIRDNASGRGAGMTIFGDDITVTGSLIEDNVSYDDHGGGIYQGGSALIEQNSIRGNRTGEDLGYGWGGGVLILGKATLRFNRIHANHAPSIGGGVFIDEGGDALMEHELIYANTTLGAGGAGVYVDGGEGPSRAEIFQCTIAHNTGAPGSEGNAVYVERESEAVLRNCILWGNGGDFYHDGTSSIAAAYTLSGEAIAGIGNLVADPLFADPDGGDFHLRSTAGRFQIGEKGTGAWVLDEVDSPGIDAGDPASPFTNEPAPNGGRVNLGVYGNTAEASKSAEGGSEGEGSMEGEGGSGATHSTDTNGDGQISLSELLRLIQFYNSERFGCADGTEDGFAPGETDESCPPHAADYNPQDWRVVLTELLRVIQFYNSEGYTACLDSEDGFCPV